MKGISILIGGDLVPTRLNYKLFIRGDLNNLVGRKLKKVIRKSDFRIFNLNVPFTDRDTPILKHGNHYRAIRSTIHGIKAMNPSLVTLANDHIMDHGKQGLFSTFRILQCNNIHYAGAGKNKKEASKPYIIELEGIRAGIYSCTGEKSILETDVLAGVNSFDPLESLDHIKGLKRLCDYVIVIYYAGKEQYPYPTPNLQKICRKMVDKGADFVICQQSHCAGCMEQYKEGTICYGQGDFIYSGSNHRGAKSGLLVELKLEKEHAKINYIPIIKYRNIVRLANKKDWSMILEPFWERSMLIKQPGFIEKEYQELANEKLKTYMKVLHGGNYLYQFINKILRDKLSMNYSKKQLLEIEHYIESGTHLELLLNGIKSRFGRRY